MSTRQRIYRTHVIVLRRRDFADADRVLTVFTPGAGKQEFIARGIRKTASRKAGHLELFTHSSLMVARGRTWDVITEAVTVESFRHMRANLDRIGQASYVAELVDRFTEIDNENEALWDLLLIALRELDASAAQPDFDARLLLRWFELHLLSISGFQPQLFHCLNCDKPLEPVTNFFTLQGGGMLCPDCAAAAPDAEPIEVDVLKVLRHLQRNVWDALRELSVRPAILQRVDALLYRYLLSVLERHLKSVDFLRRLQALSAADHAAPRAAGPPSSQ